MGNGVRVLKVMLVVMLLLILNCSASPSPTCRDDCPNDNPECPVPSFPVDLTGKIPFDAYDGTSCPFDTDSKESRDTFRGNQNRLFDVFSWETFIALNWPIMVDSSGDPQLDINGALTLLPAITGEGPPQWSAWMESSDVFKEDGSQPSWGTRKAALPTTCNVSSETERDFELKSNDRSIRVLSNKSATENINTLENFHQAFSYPLWDQNGKVVFYEILINKDEFDKIVQKELYNINGQLKYTSDPAVTVDLPYGSKQENERIGAIELKLAWKQMANGDNEERFYIREAYICDEERNWKKTKMGLVGMHIAHKTFHSMPWVWSTFEHVDNLQVNDLDVLEYAKRKKQLKPSFYDSNCPTCLVNEYPEPDDVGLRKTQVMRVLPIPKAVQQLNHEVQQKLRDAGSVWQYYELIDTQYSEEEGLMKGSLSTGPRPQSIHNGNPTPAYLTNSVIETYFQVGNQPHPRQPHNGVSNPVRIFFTQSCMGCHSQAGIADCERDENKECLKNENGEKKLIFKPGLADFSWLFKDKARWKKTD